MWNLKKHFLFTVNTNIHEKLYSFDHLTTNNKDVMLLPTSIVIKFQLANKLNNKTLLFANRILIERIVGQKLIYVKTKKHHPAFNVARGTVFGGMVTLRSNNLCKFITSFLGYSLRNLNLLFALVKKKNIKTLHDYLKNLQFGITKLLFFIILSISVDWDNFSYIYDNSIYGVDFSINTVSNNSYINKLIFSHVGFNLN